MAETIRIFEVGVRDGLQNESRAVSLLDKKWLAQSLIQAGVCDLELGAFVRPDRVPQMADTDRLYQEIQAGRLKTEKVRVWSLVPNRKGLERALKVGVRRIAVFTAATESFAKKNIGMSIKESLLEFSKVIEEARNAVGEKLEVRGYVSTAFGCPFEGVVSARAALKTIERLADLGVNQVSIGDTIGVATPQSVRDLLKPAIDMLGVKKVATHFHDTRGTALANALRALDMGVRTFDSSAGGLGGCPFAPGATGNLATEDLLYMVHGLGFKTGLDLNRLCQVSLEFSRRIKRPLTSRYLNAYAANRRSSVYWQNAQ